MIQLTRADAGMLLAAGLAVLPGLVAAGQHEAAWQLSEAIEAAEQALLDDAREEEDAGA